MSKADGHGTDEVEERWQAIRAGIAERSATAAPRPGPGAIPRPWRRTRLMIGMTAVVAVVAAVSFGAGWVTALGGPDALATSADPAPQPAARPVEAPVPAAPAPAASAPAASASTTYTYAVQSNHPVRLSYVNTAGERISLSSAETPWSVEVDSADWGADEKPSLMVSGPDDGDAFVACSITDGNGEVVAADREESASPNALCMNW